MEGRGERDKQIGPHVGLKLQLFDVWANALSTEQDRAEVDASRWDFSY